MRTVGTRKDLAEKVRFLFVHPNHSNADVEQIVLSLKQGAADLGIDVEKPWRHGAEERLNIWNSSREVSRRPEDKDYIFMLNLAITDEIFKCLARRHTVKTDDLYRTLHHELIPMLIALLPKPDHIIHKHNPSFLWLNHSAFEDLQVTELPYLRTLEIDHDTFGILDRAPHLAQVDFLNPPSYTLSWSALYRVIRRRIRDQNPALARHTLIPTARRLALLRGQGPSIARY
ncbi:hypothetical protein FVER53590_25118 [Fusarium verticillioides]|nr:hypothetical protein FVER53590_25118 [Fusarium verticillioides]